MIKDKKNSTYYVSSYIKPERCKQLCMYNKSENRETYELYRSSFFPSPPACPKCIITLTGENEWRPEIERHTGHLPSLRPSSAGKPIDQGDGGKERAYGYVRVRQEIPGPWGWKVPMLTKQSSCWNVRREGRKKNAAFCVGQSYIISHFDSIPVRLGKNNTSAHQEGF